MIIRRCRRVLPLLAVLSVVVANSASAQFGGLKKKAARMGAPGAAPAASPGAPPSVIVTPDVIDRYLAGLKARRAERDRIAKTNTPVGKYFAAQDAYRAHETHCRDFDRKRSETYSRLVAQQKYDSASALAQVRDASCETGMSQPQEPEFQDLAGAQGTEDTAAAVGAGMDVNAWASLDEWIPQLMYQMVNSPERTTAELASNFGRKPGEVEALKARKDEVATALGIPPRQKPVEHQQVATPEPPPAMPANTPGMPSQGSALFMQTEMNNQQARIEALAAKGQAAQKANDMATTMAIADTVNGINMTVMRKCGMMK